MPVTRPSSAKTSPTSPRGTIPMPIAICVLLGWEMHIAPPNLPAIATTSSARDTTQVWVDPQSTTLRSRDSPTITKKIGVNSRTMGFICDRIRSEK